MKLSWNQHIDWIATKLCSAFYVLRNLIHIVPQSTLRTIYYAYIHSILSYGIISGENSTNVKLFILQKKIVRILSNIGARESCKGAFKIWKLWRCIPNTFSHWLYSQLTINTYSPLTMRDINIQLGITQTYTCQPLICLNSTKNPTYRALKLLITCLSI